MTVPKSFIHNGKTQPTLEPLALKAGRLTLLFEPDTGFLRRIKVGDFEVIRAIYGAVRDENWNTLPPKVSEVRQEEMSDGFRLNFSVDCQKDDIDFGWKGTIETKEEGALVFEFEGKARSTFKRNRIGLCVLLPVWECAGKPCQVTHGDGLQSKGEIPKWISPHQPFKDIQAITYEPAPGVRAEVAFEGDVFEMEDQRNWTDASFKVYSTPLDQPFPVEVQSGTEIRQTVRLTLSGNHQKILPILEGRPPQISIATTPVLAKPKLGLGVSSLDRSLTGTEVDRIRALRLNHLRVELDLTQPDSTDRINIAIQDSEALSIGLHMALMISDRAEEELNRLNETLGQRSSLSVALWQIFHQNEKVTDEKWLRLAFEVLGSLAPSALFAGGTNAYFTELNRDRPTSNSLGLPAYSINPQVHADDDLSLVENLAAQATTVESCGQFHSKSVVVSPITLKPRFNPNATTNAVSRQENELPPEVDSRQMSLFGAGWTLGSLSNLSIVSTRLHQLTYFETVGWRGVMESESGSKAPDLFPSIPGAVYPVYFVFAWIAAYQRLYVSHSSHPLQCAALTVLNEKNQRRVLVANLTGHPLNVRVKSGTAKGKVVYLDETTVDDAMRDPQRFLGDDGKEIGSAAGKLSLDFKPFGLVKVDLI